MPRIAERRSDISDRTIRLVLFAEGDVLVTIGGNVGSIGDTAAIFRYSTASGGRSPNTLLALRQLAEAIEKDNAENP